MSDRDMDLLARKIVTLERQQNAASRSTQLPVSSVRLTDGTDYDLTDGLETAIDVQEDVTILTEYTDGISGHVDEVVDYTIDVPEWIQATGAGSDESWEATQFAIDLAEEIGERVDEAQADADAAAQAAANAQVTADGKNSRRRGQTQPPAPETGWAQGDQWIVDNAQGVPVEVRVWNGTAFVKEQTIASDLLVLGADGAVRISNGKITAPMLSVDALDFKVAQGMEIFGGRIVGGEILLADYVQDERKWVHQCNTLVGVDNSQTTLTLDTSRKKSGTASIKANDGSRFTGFAVSTQVNVNKVTAWVYSEVDRQIEIHAWELSGFEPQTKNIKAGVWTEVTAESQDAGVPVKPVLYVSINSTGTQAGGPHPLWIDQVEARLITPSNDSGIRLFRAEGGQSLLESVNDGNRTRVTGGGIYFDRTNNPNYGLFSIGPWGIESSDSNSRLRFSKSNSSPGVGLDLVAGNSPSNTAAISLTGYGSRVFIDAANIEFRDDEPWTTVNPIAPFALYSAGTPARVINDKGTVTLSGTLTCTTANYITSTTQRTMMTLPAKFRPNRYVTQVCQGSGNERWHLEIETNGNVMASRYSGTQGNNVWLPFNVSFPFN